MSILPIKSDGAQIKVAYTTLIYNLQMPLT